MANTSRIHLATTCNDSYFPGLCVTVVSAIVATDPSRPITFHIFDTGLSPENHKKLRAAAKNLEPGATINFIPVTGAKFSGLTLDYGGGFSAYVRIIMGSLINESKVIYIDSDFLVLSNLSDVYDKELNGNIILASKDVDTTDGLPNHLSIDCPFVDPKEVESFFYYNTGFLLVDLDSWRDYGVEESALNLIQNYKGHLNAWDQTILNYILRGRIGNLDPSFCWSSSLGKIPYPGNIHYISKQKPWNGWSIIASYKLWYMFYRIFLKDIFPIEISLKQKIKGILQYHRDAIFEKANFLLLFYQNYLIKKVGSRSAALYTFSIRRNSERKQHPDWKCVALISSLSRKWSLRKTSLIHNKDASAS